MRQLICQQPANCNQAECLYYFMFNYGLMAAHGCKWCSQLNIVFISHGTMASRLAVQWGAILLWLACFGLTMQSGTELRRLSIRCYIAIYIQHHSCLLHTLHNSQSGYSSQTQTKCLCWCSCLTSQWGQKKFLKSSLCFWDMWHCLLSNLISCVILSLSICDSQYHGLRTPRKNFTGMTVLAYVDSH